MIFAKGLKRSTPARVAHRLGAQMHPRIAAALAAGPKGAADFSGFWSTPFNQSNTETCFAHSGSMLAVVASAAAGAPLRYVPSPLLIASCTYADVRAASTPVGQVLPPLSDTGAELQDVADAIARWGFAPLGPLQPDRYSDVPNDQPGVPFPEVDRAQLSRAIPSAGEYSITVDNQAPLVVAASLDCGIPVWTGGLVGTIFESATDPNIAVGPDTTGGGHAMGILKYRTNPTTGALEFFPESSWGPFGLNGGRWVSALWVCAQWELWPYAIRGNS